MERVRTIALSILLASIVGVLTPAFAAYFPDPVPSAHTLTLSGTATLNGSPLLVDDEVAVYSVHPDPETAGKWDRSVIGLAILSDAYLPSITVYGDDDNTTSTVEGAAVGEELSLVLWRASEGRIYTAYRTPLGDPLAVRYTADGASLDVAVDFTSGVRIPLRTNGWSLFSAPVLSGWWKTDSASLTSPQLDNATYDNVVSMADAFPLRSIEGAYDRIIGNDGGGAKLWVPTLPEISTLNAIQPGYGYWVKTKVSTQPLIWMTFPGTETTGYETLSLTAGWKLLGFWKGPHIYNDPTVADPMSLLLPLAVADNVALGSMGDLWATIAGSYARVTSFDAGAKLWSPDLPEISTLKYLAPGHGYWVKMTSAAELSHSAVGAPLFSPSPGTYNSAQNVTLRSGTTGATIRYTIDNTVPTSTTGTLYTDAIPLDLDSETTIKAIAYNNDLSDSSVAVGTFVITDIVGEPVFSVTPGTYTSAQTVTISTTTSDASIRYTLDNTVPTSTTGTLYTGAITLDLDSATTIKAIAYKSDLADSLVAVGAYVITGTVAEPSFSSSPGIFTSMRIVTLSTTTSGASIRYTINNTTPTSTTGTLYSGAITVSATTTIKAIAYKASWADSSVASGVYSLIDLKTTVAAGGNHVAAIRSDAALYAFGYNYFGQVGDGSNTTRNTPVRVGTEARWVSIAAGANFTVALRNDGTLWASGHNSYGQLGDSSTTNRLSPVQIGTATTWKSISAGNSFAVALKTDGSIWAWGENSFGQLGDKTIVTRTAPVRVGTGNDWAYVAAGRNHTLAVKTNGTLWTWGKNEFGQLGDGTTTDLWEPTQIGTSSDWALVAGGERHTLAITSDGKLWGWGANTRGQVGDGTNESRLAPVRIGSDNDWSWVAAGQYHSIGLKSDGTVRGWGANDTAQADGASTVDLDAPTVVSVSGTFVRVSAGDGHSTAMTSANSLRVWGNNYFGQQGDGTTTNKVVPNQVGTATGWSRTVSGFNHSLALKSDGSLWGWGSNSNGQIGDNTTTRKLTPTAIRSGTSFVDLSGGGSHSVAIADNGSLWAWGANSSGQLGDGSQIDRLEPKQIATSGWSKIAAGGTFTVGIKTTGTLWVWGERVGAAVPSFQKTPLQIGTDTTWVEVAAGDKHVLARKSTGTVWGWGVNLTGQVGNNSTTNQTAPVQVGTATNWAHIAAGMSHSLAVNSSGAVYAWGSNLSGQLTDGGTLGFNPTFMSTPLLVASSFPGGANDPFAGGGGHSLAIRSGALYAWGLDSSGQLGADYDGTTFPTRVGTESAWFGVAAGANHSLAVKTGGTLWAWGDNFYGQLGNGDLFRIPHTVSF